MKTLILLLLCFQLCAQSTSETVGISGLVKNNLNLKVSDLQGMKIVEGTNFKVVSSSGEVRKEFKTYKGVLLRDLLEKAEIVVQNPKEKGSLFIIATATDGYTTNFAYHDIFNNPTGDSVLVLFEENGKPIEKDGAMVLISATDKITGARHVKWLKSIEVRKI